MPAFAGGDMMAPHPTVFQMPQAAMVSQTFWSESRNLVGTVISPESSISVLTRPVVENMENAIM